MRVNEGARWFAPFRFQQDDRFEVKCAEVGVFEDNFLRYVGLTAGSFIAG